MFQKESINKVGIEFSLWVAPSSQQQTIIKVTLIPGSKFQGESLVQDCVIRISDLFVVRPLEVLIRYVGVQTINVAILRAKVSRRAVKIIEN